jgi:hypothetical protein
VTLGLSQGRVYPVRRTDRGACLLRNTVSPRGAPFVLVLSKAKIGATPGYRIPKTRSTSRVPDRAPSADAVGLRLGFSGFPLVVAGFGGRVKLSKNIPL